MTTAVVASAPGKIVLSGEYAVLDGAPAIVMAVDRRARVVLADDVGNIGQIRAPGYTEEIGRFQVADGGIRWLEGQALYRVVDSVWRAADALPSGGQRIDLDTSDFVDPERQQKIGIGSSAALTVALCAAVKRSADWGTIMDVAQRAHGDLQGGAGSGVDIACSLRGGLIEYRREGASVAALDWPQALFYRVVWTGVSASTRDKLRKLNTGASLPSRVRLAGASECMADAWRSGDADGIIKNYRSYIEDLRQFSIDHGLGIFDAGHEDIWRKAIDFQLTYKPCGAGGGDVGIVFGTDDAVLDSFMEELANRFKLLDCSLSPIGAMIDSAEEEIA
jgi:phosphomevalonate kinase